MQFTVPDIEPTLNAMQSVRSEFNGVNKLISWWVLDTRKDIEKNKKFFDVDAKATIAGVAVTCKPTADNKAAQWVGAKH